MTLMVEVTLKWLIQRLLVYKNIHNPICKKNCIVKERQLRWRDEYRLHAILIITDSTKVFLEYVHLINQTHTLYSCILCSRVVKFWSTCAEIIIYIWIIYHLPKYFLEIESMGKHTCVLIVYMPVVLQKRIKNNLNWN